MADTPMTDAELLASSPFDDDLDTELAARPQRRDLPGPTLYLAAGIILVAGFLGGVQAQKWSTDGSRPSDAGGQAAGPEGGRARSGYGGPPGFSGQPGAGAMPGGSRGAGPGAGTVGTVTKVVGNTVYLRTSSGKTVKVTTNGTTKVRIAKDGRLRDISKGSTVVVQGPTNTNGTVTATTVTEGRTR